jgi:anti-anti-sigma regulatory factor
MASPGFGNSRVALAINLELSHGRHGAAARIEMDDGVPGGSARVALRGWIERSAMRRLLDTLDGLRARGVHGVTLDWSQVRHVDARQVSGLVTALSRLEARGGACAMLGLSHHLRDLFLLAGCDPDRLGAGAAAGAGAPHGKRSAREWAS